MNTNLRSFLVLLPMGIIMVLEIGLDFIAYLAKQSNHGLQWCAGRLIDWATN